MHTQLYWLFCGYLIMFSKRFGRWWIWRVSVRMRTHRSLRGKGSLHWNVCVLRQSCRACGFGAGVWQFCTSGTTSERGQLCTGTAWLWSFSLQFRRLPRPAACSASAAQQQQQDEGDAFCVRLPLAALNDLSTNQIVDTACCVVDSVFRKSRRLH